MEFEINRDHFATGLQKVQNIVSSRTTIAILGNVLLRAEKDQIELTTTNLDLGIRCQIKAEVKETGAITLPVRKLTAIVKALPKLEVDVSTSPSHQVKIRSGGAFFKISGIEDKEFPRLPAFTDEPQFVLPQLELLKMIKSVSYAQSTDENRYVLNGIYFNFKEKKLTLVATDGRRLGMINQEFAIDEVASRNFILPAKTTAELERLLGIGETVSITHNEKQVGMEVNVGEAGKETGLTGTVKLVTKTVEGNYPNYRQVIPKETTERVKLDRELLLECLSRATIVASEKNNSVVLKLGKNTLEIHGSSPELGESHECMAIPYEGKDIELAFNPHFLMDPLRALPKDEVFFEFKDELSPGLFKTADDFLCVVMPLRLG